MPSDWLLNPVYFIGGRSAFGWIKCVNGLRQAKLSCLAIIDWAFTFAPAAYRSGAAAEADRNGAMTAPVVNRELIGPWRIIEADLWDHDYLDTGRTD